MILKRTLSPISKYFLLHFPFLPTIVPLLIADALSQYLPVTSVSSIVANVQHRLSQCQKGKRARKEIKKMIRRERKRGDEEEMKAEEEFWVLVEKAMGM